MSLHPLVSGWCPVDFFVVIQAQEGNEKRVQGEKKIHQAVGETTKEGGVFKPKQLLTPFSSHSPPSTLHAPSPSLDDKGNRLQTEHEYSYNSGNDANHKTFTLNRC
jgi:hypothetical protein